MNEITVTDEQQFSCQFCKRNFIREKSWVNHICEYKHRWLEKEKQGNRIGFLSWVRFYTKNTNSKKNKTYEEFIRSAYYTAFVKYGNYCVAVNAINIDRFTDWLIKNQVKIDNWCQDATYTRYLCEYLRVEDPMDAIARSVDTAAEKAQEERIQTKDYLRYCNPNKICYQITLGKISPWMLYQSDSGIHFLETLNPEHVKIVADFINPELWALRFKRDPETTEAVKTALKMAGF